ncbi:Conserved_hypothetical protein [Hexamita inflata]|uniref:Uncharacterized protein n=1 Tax=Hexamita inflata TaxID=28002 RepID=A0AA86QT22_9EUKA|nr:Conserved hypothetical protein [Hexamita inflata]
MLNGITSEIDAQTELEGCYSELSRVVLKEDQAQICVQLISAGNSSCKKLPKGVKVSIELDNLSGFYTPTGYFSDFDYSSTAELCVSCTNQACIDKVFYESKTASAVIESYGLKASVAVGVVIREQLDFDNCIKQTVLKVFKSQIQLSVEFQDYCWQTLINNNFNILNSTMLLRFQETQLQLVYAPGIQGQCDINGKFIVFTHTNLDAYSLFDQNNYIDTKIWITIQQSNTINILVATSNNVIIDGLPSGYSKLSLRINQNIMQLTGTPSDIGNSYAQQVISDGVDYYHIKLKISLGKETYFFDSNDLQNYQIGQTQAFICSNIDCETNMKYVFKNLNIIESASTVTSMKKQGSILHMVTETVTKFYEGCYNGFDLKHDHEQVYLELDLNEQSTTCAITTNQSYQMALLCKNQSLTQIMAFEYTLNKSTTFVSHAAVISESQLAMIRSSQRTVLLINQQDGTTVEYSFLQKVVDLDTSGFLRSQIIILVVSLAVISVVEVARDLFLQFCRNPSKSRAKKIQIKDFDELQ